MGPGDRRPSVRPEGPAALAVGGIGPGEQRVVVSLSVSSRNVCGMSERPFRRIPGGVCSLGLQPVWCPKYTDEHGWEIVAAKEVLWSPSYFAASVGYVSELTVRRYIEHQWDAVA